jgi:hypothetical protein|tara:strand:+ start:209 stop:628 length:420 start_codon:yes stop_codon:yes gene_type:complete
MTKKKNKTVTMSVPDGLEFDTPYTMNSTDEKDYNRNKFYWDVDRNKDPWKPASPKFGWHLDKVVEKITNLLKEKNEAYGNTALNPTNIFSKLDSTEAICARIDDKLARIANRGINDETEDTVDDVIGYLLLLKMSMEKK